LNDKRIRNILKLIFSFLFYYLGFFPLIARFFLKKGLYIFNYHSFNTFTNHYFKFGSLFQSNYQDNFEKQTKFLLKYFSKARCVQEQIVNDNRKSFLMTFDDGYRDNYTLALPIIKKYSLPAVFFIPTIILEGNGLLWHDQIRFFYEQEEKKKKINPQRLKRDCKKKLNELKSLEINDLDEQIREISMLAGKHERLMLNWDELKECHDSGVIIAPHTHSHYILSRLGQERKTFEISKSIEILRSGLDIKGISHFGIPDGKIGSLDSETLGILHEYGIRSVYLTEVGINRVNGSRDADANADINIKKRIGINPSDPIPVVMLKIIQANLVRDLAN
jgi:peptidoglycan/xylan/chitin deacetylase (PgdA/CDA1 family)